MGKATLVIMAAGIGSRFGGGIKQLEPVGPNGEIIMDYSIYDAMKAGFDKVVFVIRKDLEKDFRAVIGDRIEKKIKVEYAFQELDDVPEQYRNIVKDRKKPWGTGQAILCCKNVVNEPFLVINADDYYGKAAYVEAFKELTSLKKMPGDRMQISMIGFVLRNTLSENGGVTRGICKVDERHMLREIMETHNIVKISESNAVEAESGKHIDMDSVVSMNMWGLQPEFFNILETGFSEFLSGLNEADLKREYLLPTIIGNLLKEQKVDVKVLQSHDKWFGVTYREDKDGVVAAIRKLVDEGYYN